MPTQLARTLLQVTLVAFAAMKRVLRARRTDEVLKSMLTAWRWCKSRYIRNKSGGSKIGAGWKTAGQGDLDGLSYTQYRGRLLWYIYPSP